MSKPAAVGIVAILILATGLAAGYLLSYQRYHGDQRKAAAAEQQNQVNKIRRSCVFDPSSRVLTCDVHPEQGEGGEKYTAYDLEAQQDMAEWAFAMFAASLLGVLITGAATYYVAMTLNETRVMAGEAKRSSDAAITMAKIMTGIEVPIVQALWYRTEVIATRHAIEPDASFSGQVLQRPSMSSNYVVDTVHFRNFGKTIAIPTRVLTGFSLAKVLPPEPKFIQSVALSRGQIIQPEPQDDPFRAEIGLNVTADQQELEAWAAGDVDLWVYLSVTYLDFLGQEHTKRFCARWAQRPRGMGIYYFDSDGDPPDEYTKQT